MKKYIFYNQAYTYPEAKKIIADMEKNIWSDQSRYPQILPLIDGDKILDYGCGWGIFTKAVSRVHKREVLGIDTDKESLKVAKDLIGESGNLKFRSQNLSQIKSESFDTVISCQVLEHTWNPGKYLSECNRVLKKGGKLIISIPNEMNIVFFISQLLISQKRINKIFSKKYEKEHDHIQSWTFYNFCRLINSLGFKYKRHIFTEGIPFIRGYLRWNIPILKNLSYTVVYILEKDKYVNPDENY